MSFVRTYTKKNGRQYRALVEDYRRGGKVRQRILKWLGPVGGYKRKRFVAKHTPAYDVQGAFMLGLPYRIVYELVTGSRIDRLKERMAHPNFFRMTADDPRGWRRPTLEAVLTQSHNAGLRSWAREMSCTRPRDEMLKSENQRRALREFAASLKSQAKTARAPEERHMALHDLNQRQWANYNAKITADVERTHLGNIQYARENNLNAPQYGIVQDAAPSTEDGAESEPPGEPGEHES
jgi:hypothetical protein